MVIAAGPEQRAVGKQRTARRLCPDADALDVDDSELDEPEEEQQTAPGGGPSPPEYCALRALGVGERPATRAGHQDREVSGVHDNASQAH